MKMFNKDTRKRCHQDKKHPIKMYSTENHMNPGKVPPELKNFTMTECV